MRASFIASLLLFAASASADVPPQDSEGCSGKSVGAACTRDNGNAATCKASTCSKLDYSQGTPPKSVSYDCLLCTGEPATAAESTASSSGCTAGGSGDVAPLALLLVGAMALLRRTRGV